MGKEDETYRYINNIGNARDVMKQSSAAFGFSAGQNDVYERKYQIYDAMTPEEIGIYNYIYATQGKEAAQEYLTYQSDFFNRRKAQGRHRA